MKCFSGAPASISILLNRRILTWKCVLDSIRLLGLDLYGPCSCQHFWILVALDGFSAKGPYFGRLLTSINSNFSLATSTVDGKWRSWIHQIHLTMPFLSAVEVAKLDFWHPKMPAMRLFKTNDTAVRAENIAASQAWEPPLLIPTAHSLAVLDIKRHLQFLAVNAR